MTISDRQNTTIFCTSVILLRLLDQFLNLPVWHALCILCRLWLVRLVVFQLGKGRASVSRLLSGQELEMKQLLAIGVLALGLLASSAASAQAQHFHGHHGVGHHHVNYGRGGYGVAVGGSRTVISVGFGNVGGYYGYGRPVYGGGFYAPSTIYRPVYPVAPIYSSGFYGGSFYGGGYYGGGCNRGYGRW